MNDLKSKTDEELRDIMRASIDNSYVLSSIYHKAKQELDFRATRLRQERYSQVFNGSVGAVIGENHGQSIATVNTEDDSNKAWKNPLFLTILGILGSIGVAYIVHIFDWN